MAYNGAGTFSVYTPGTPYVTGTVISSTVANNVNSDFATGLSTAITKNGQTTVTANIPFGGFKLTGIANGSVATDAMAYGQIATASGQALSSVAGTNTITAAATPTLTAYATGQFFRFIAANTCSGATTINIDSVGAKNIFRNGIACVSGDIVINKIYGIFYDGTQFNLQETNEFAKSGANADITSLAPTGNLGLNPTGGTISTTNAIVGAKFFQLYNPDTGAGSYVQHYLQTNAGTLTFLLGSTAQGSAANLSSTVTAAPFNIYTTGAANLQLGTNGTVGRLVIDTSGVIYAGGSAIWSAPGKIYSVTTAKVWVKFTSITTTAIIASMNVSSLTDNGVGDTTISFSVTLADANYCWVGTSNLQSNVMNGGTFTPSTTQLRVRAEAETTAAAQDAIQHVMVIGN